MRSLSARSVLTDCQEEWKEREKKPRRGKEMKEKESEEK